MWPAVVGDGEPIDPTETGEDDLAHDVRAPAVRPAEKRRGVIHVGDRRSGGEIAPDPAGDGTRSTDW